MDLRQRLVEYLESSYMMQLATVSGEQPWCCTVYYIFDKNLNIYWASLPSRRHSQEIAAHSKVAAAIPIKFVKGQKIIGIQVEGNAELIDDTKIIQPLAQKYANKFDRDVQWVKDFSSLNTEHRLYKLTPKQFVLFDEVNYPPNTRLEWKP